MQPPPPHLFRGRLDPMLVADDERHYVNCNTAACLLLRLPSERILELRIDDLTPAEQRPRLDELWSAFIRDGSQEGSYELATPDGCLVTVGYTAVANVEPGRHLAVLHLRADADEPGGDTPAAGGGVLSPRELQVLSLVARGSSGREIARELEISVETVRTHVNNARGKLGARTKAHAVALGVTTGLIGI